MITINIKVRWRY